MTTSWQAEKERRERELYVSRETDGVLEQALVGDAEGSRKLLFAVSGDGGLGKSTLIRQFQRVAIESGGLCAVSNHEITPAVPEVLAHLAAQLRDQGAPLRQFENRYKRYQDHLHRLRADPAAPLGVAGILAGTVARIGLSVIEEVPGGSFAVGTVDKQELAKQAAVWADFVAAKTRRAEDRRLVLEPESELSPIFLSDIRAIAHERQVILCFDTYEQTSPYLDAWLRSVIDGKHGEVPMAVRIVIAGRDELSPNDWAAYEWLVARVRLPPFTVDQSRSYLKSAGITDERVILNYHARAHGMPLLLATLAVAPVVEGGPIPLGEEVAVDCFLDPIGEDTDRQAVIDAALPRLLNEETFAVARAHPNGQPSFAWLVRLPFLDPHPRGWVYHDVVREHMLDLHRRLKPQSWRETHTRLSEYYERRYDQSKQLPAAEDQELYAEYVYHFLCAKPEQLPEIIGTVIILACEANQVPVACADAIVEAGRAAGLPQIVRLGESTREALTAIDDGAWSAARDFFDEVIALELSTQARGTCHMLRALSAFEANEFEDAAADASIAMQVVPEFEDVASNIVMFARVASGDLAAAFELLPGMLADNDPLYRASGLVASGRFEEAIAEADSALSEDPENDAVLYMRSVALLRLGHFDAAILDAESSIELDPDMPEYRLPLTRAYLELDRPEDALTQIDAAIAMRPQSPVFRAFRAEVLATLDRRSDALADATYATEAWPAVYTYRLTRGKIHARFMDYEDAISELEKALELMDATNAPLVADRVEIYLQLGLVRDKLGDATGAIEDLNRGVEIAETVGGFTLLQALSARATVSNSQSRYADAAQDWRRVLPLTESTSGLTHRKAADMRLRLGRTLCLSGDTTGAIAELERAATFYEQQGQQGLDLAHTLYWLGYAHTTLDPRAAEDLLRRATAIYERQGAEQEDALATCLAQLGFVHRQLGQGLTACAELDRALTMRRSIDGSYSPSLWFVLGELGTALGELGENVGATTALEWLLEANDDTDPEAAKVKETLNALTALSPNSIQDHPALRRTGAALSHPRVPLAHPRVPLAHLRRRALEGADLSSDLRRAIADIAGRAARANRWQELAASWEVPADSIAEERPSTQASEAPDSAARQALAAYEAREAKFGPEIMRVLERHVVLTSLSASVELAREARTTNEDSTQTRETMVLAVWRHAVQYLFVAELEIQEAPPADRSNGGGARGEDLPE